MANALHYVVIRYRPLPELAEFANIGVSVFNPKTGQITYKLAPRRFRRVTQFFDNIHSSSYSEAIGVLEQELDRMRAISSIRSPDTIRHLFVSFVAKRESVITFSEIHSIFGVDESSFKNAYNHDDEVVRRLYERFVRRNLESLPQREVGMVREIREKLHNVGIYSFKARLIGDELMPIRLPLVSQNRRRAVIKPMAFDQKTTLAIIDHANIWRDRIKYLIEKRLLNPENILIPVERPEADSESILMEAFDIARESLEKLPVELLDYAEYPEPSLAILEFAARSGSGEGHLLN